MDLIKKIIRKIQEGKLKELFEELCWIYTYGLKYKKNVFWYIGLGITGTIMGLTGSVISKHIIDAVTRYDSNGLMLIIVVYAFLQLFMIGMRAMSSKVSAQIEIKVDQEIRADIYNKIMEADWEAMSQFHSGDLLNRVDNDVSSVSASVIGWIPELITRVIQFVGTFVVILYYDPTLALLALISAPVTLCFSRMLTKRIRSYNKEIREMNSEVMIFQEESFHYLQIIKSFGSVSFYKEKLSQVQDKYRSIRLDYNDFVIKSNMLMTLVGTMVTGICFGWGVYRFWSGFITLGTMTLFLQMASMLRGSFGSLIHMVPTAISAATAAGRLMAVTELPEETHLFEEEVELLKKNKSAIEIQAKNMSFHYKSGKNVIVESDFSARPGEIVGLIGRSGEGKTTLLRILLGLVSAKDGNVEIVDKNLNVRIPVSAATRTFFSYVPQHNVMFFDTIAENMRIVKKDATEEEIIDALKQACAYEFVEPLPEGIYSKISENGGGFSEGQIQRLSIARALLSQAPILLLDEATSALDIITEKQILQNLVEKHDKRIVIFVTHRYEVLSSCHKVYKIENKKISETC